MKSSASRSNLFMHPINYKEIEYLLDDEMIDDAGVPPLLEVVVEEDPRFKKYYFSDEIETCIALLHSLEAETKSVQNSLLKKPRIYLGLTLLLAASAITGPSLFIEFILDASLRRYHEVIKQHQQVIDGYHADIESIEKKLAHTLSEYTSNLQLLLKKLHKAFQEDKLNCMYNSDGRESSVDGKLIDYIGFVGTDMFCDMYEHLQETSSDGYPPYPPFDQGCVAEWKAACNIIEQNEELVKQVNEGGYVIVSLKSREDVLKDNIDLMLRKIEDTSNPDTQTRLGIIGGVATIGTLLMLVVGLLIRLHGNFKNNIKKSHQVKTRISELTPLHSELLKTLTDKLNIPITDNTTIAGLITALEQKLQEINQRWEYRTAFLGGALRRDATTHSFFKADKNRDMSRLILSKVEFPQNVADPEIGIQCFFNNNNR